MECNKLKGGGGWWTMCWVVEVKDTLDVVEARCR